MQVESRTKSYYLPTISFYLKAVFSPSVQVVMELALCISTLDKVTYVLFIIWLKKIYGNIQITLLFVLLPYLQNIAGGSISWWQ